MKIAKINKTGLNEIKFFLGRFHKLGENHFTFSMLYAWACEAENSFSCGNGMYFEIKKTDSITGRAEIVIISSKGFDVENSTC